MPLRVTLIQGGGGGLDQVPAVTEVLRAADIPIQWEEFLAGWASVERGGEALPKAMLASVRSTGVALKTSLMPRPDDPATHLPLVGGNYNVQLRRELGLFASVRPLKNLPGLPSRFEGVNLLILRELTEDLYASIEHEIVPGVVQSIKVVTEAASKRFFRFALNWARSAGRKTVTCVHKANILKLADGLFLEAFREIAQEFPDLTCRDMIIDNCCMQMVSRPQQFDVMVMGNLFGDLVSDLGAGIVGGVSATHAISVGDGIRVYDSFQSAGDLHPLFNHANPLPLLLPAIDLLEAMGEKQASQRIQTAVSRVLTARAMLTDDLGGKATTSEMTRALIDALP
jgi:isocitrate dehydrogenase (NAD+)